MARSTTPFPHLGPAPAAPRPNEPAPWQVISQTEVYRNPWSVVFEESLSGPQQQRGLYGYFAAVDCVVVVPLWPENGGVYTALVEQWRQPIRQNTWEVPCGRIEEGETTHSAAARELAEECGLAAQRWLPLGQWQHSDARVAGTIYAYLALDLSSTKAVKDAAEIDLSAFRLPLHGADGALSAISDGRLCQVASMSALFSAAQHPAVQALDSAS